MKRVIICDFCLIVTYWKLTVSHFSFYTFDDLLADVLFFLESNKALLFLIVITLS